MEAVNLGAYLTQICDNDDMISSEQVAGDDTIPGNYDFERDALYYIRTIYNAD